MGRSSCPLAASSGLRISLASGHIAPISVSVFMWPSFLRMSKCLSLYKDTNHWIKIQHIQYDFILTSSHLKRLSPDKVPFTGAGV